MAGARMSVSPKILTWAVERLGTNIEDYCVENQNFRSWIDGEIRPTFNQVKDFARKFYVPLGYMFLETPPAEQIPIPLFRKKSNARQDINVIDTIKLISERQEWLSMYLQDNGFSKLEYVGKFKNIRETSIENICVYAKEILVLGDDWTFHYSNIQDVINEIVRKLENIGIIVVFNSVVGYNNTRKIDIETCRGFALTDEYAPFIFINSRDAKVAQLFTIVHEMAHILTGYTAGISDIDINDNNISEQERFCNKIAANFLLPEKLFKEFWHKNNDIDTLSKKFKVSRYVIGIRAKELGLLSKEKLEYYIKQWAKIDTSAKHTSNGGNFHATAVKRTGKTFLIHLSNALESNQILYTDAYRLSGLKGRSFNDILNSKYVYQR